MNTPDPDILERLRPLVVKVLSVEPDEVVPDAEWEAYLGGESIDLIELGFYCDKEFGVRMKFDIAADDIIRDDRGVLTPESITRLKARFPQLKLDGWENRRLDKALQLITIGSLAGFVQSALEPATR
jgi:acyl carrier protein